MLCPLESFAWGRTAGGVSAGSRVSISLGRSVPTSAADWPAMDTSDCIQSLRGGIVFCRDSLATVCEVHDVSSSEARVSFAPARPRVRALLGTSPSAEGLAVDQHNRSRGYLHCRLSEIGHHLVAE